MDLPGAAVEVFEDGKFEQLAADLPIRRLASQRVVVVVWCESMSEWARVRALRVPPGRTLSSTLGVPVGETMNSVYGKLREDTLVAYSGISRVVIFRGGHRVAVVEGTVVGSDEVSEQNPVLQPGSIVFVEEALPPPLWWKVQSDPTGSAID